MLVFEDDTLDKIYIGTDKVITIKKIYYEIERKKSEKFSSIIFQNKKVLIKLKKIEEDFYVIEINDKIKNKNKSYELLKKPIEINIKDIIGKEKIIKIINEQQYHKIQSNYSQKLFHCSAKKKDVILCNLLFANMIIDHSDCKGNHFIKNIFKINMDENKFNSYFIKHEIFTDYSSVYDFEIHYDDYFTESKYIIDKSKYKFIVYGKNDRNRTRAIYIFNKSFLSFKDKIYLFYGKSGMGKSLILIGTLKYKYKHDEVGTLYIHCKLLYNLIQTNYAKAKTILKDEAVYLFQNEYKDYIECCYKIDSYRINENTTFWDLIKVIVSCLTFKEKDYLLAFDQYNEEIIDPNNKELKALHSYNGKKLGVIAVCSLDDKGIHNYKINDFINPNSPQINFVTEEIVSTLDIDNLSIDDGHIFDQTLAKIGKTIKNYDALKYIHDYQKEEDLNKYVDELRKGILDYLMKFYKINEKPDFNFLRCWTNTYYSIDNDLKNIKDYISFKYFDIRKNPDINKNEFEIIYLYPIVEEIMVELFSKMFYKNFKFMVISNLLNIDGGAKGYVFEKYVIHKMKPENNNHSPLFGYFKIDRIIKCDKFVPKKNENFDKFKKLNQTFEKGKTYLFEQRIFGGKAFDVAIIEFKEDGKVFAYVYQITINKKLEDIFDDEQLKNYIKNFIEYFYIIYTIDFTDVYFNYILDFENNDMADRCDIKLMPYIFFDPKIDAFKDSNENEILNFNFDKFIYPVSIDSEHLFKKKSIIYGLLNTAQEQSITKFIKEKPFFGLKKVKTAYFELCKDTIDYVLEKNKQKSRFFLLQLDKKQTIECYKLLYEYDKKFVKKNRNILNYGSLIFYYFDNNKSLISNLILFNGNIYPFKNIPGYIVTNHNYYCYEICTI